MKFRSDFDRGCKIGVSWDRITMMGRHVRVLLFHFGPWVYSFSWFSKQKGSKGSTVWPVTSRMAKFGGSTNRG